MTQTSPETTSAETTPTATSFNTGLFIVLGVAFWIVGLISIRLAGDARFDFFVNSDALLLLLFTAYIPVAWIFVKIIAVVSQLEGNALLRAVSVSALTAALLDGVGLTWFQNLYGLGQSELLFAAAWLLWGTGISLSVGCWVSRR